MKNLDKMVPSGSVAEKLNSEVTVIYSETEFAGQKLPLKVQIPVYRRNPDRWHRHDGFYELVICRSGSALQECWNRNQFDMIHAGMCYLLPPGSIHRYRRINDFHHYNILCSPELLVRCLNGLETWGGSSGFFTLENDSPRIFSLGENELAVAVRIVEDIHGELFQKQPGFVEACHAEMTRLLIHLLRNCNCSDSIVDPRCDRIVSVVRMMENSCEKHHTLESLAKGTGMSISCFRHNFVLVTGLSPIAYLNRLRLKKGAMLLTLPGSVSTIASKCGMCDSNYFTKMFHRATGMTPSAFRREWTTMNMDEFMRRIDEA